LFVGLSFSYIYFLSTKPFAAAIWRQNRHSVSILPLLKPIWFLFKLLPRVE